MFSFKKRLLGIKEYLRRNLGASFIVGFQILLLVCGCLLILDNSSWAEEVAIVAYFSLVIGVVLQLISFLRRKNEELEDNE